MDQCAGEVKAGLILGAFSVHMAFSHETEWRRVGVVVALDCFYTLGMLILFILFFLSGGGAEGERKNLRLHTQHRAGLHLMTL